MTTRLTVYRSKLMSWTLCSPEKCTLMVATRLATNLILTLNSTAIYDNTIFPSINHIV